MLCLANFTIAQEKSVVKWWDPATSEFPVIAGQAWPDEVGAPYDRLPIRAEKNVREPVWHLSKHSAGLSVRFWTNAKNIQVRYQVKGEKALPHMPATGVSGLDLYSKSYHGEWLRCWGTYQLNEESNYHFIIDQNDQTYEKYGQEYQLFLPLYNEVVKLEIGVAEESFLNPLPLRGEKAIVAYGTSICQGACASRPGMAWTSILERKLERPFINLGFSGNGRMEPELIDLLAEIDAKLYILDCLPNLSPQKHDTYQLTVNAVKRLRKKRPGVPIILTAHLGYAHDRNNQKSRNKYQALNKALIRAVNQLKSEGYSNVFLLQKEELGLSFDSYVDQIHPNDYGMVQYAEAYEKLIRKVLNEKTGNISTTIPKTQSRDISIYKWEERHQQILDLNKADQPEICLFGNSIIHFWGGKPVAKIARGQDSWKNVLEPMGIRNYGFGWDRIENVLWRVHHGALDGFKAKKIVLMIGTNNLHLNNDAEIISGLEVLIAAIRNRQAQSQLFIMGILPRRGGEQRIERLNLKISQLADLADMVYADIGGDLLLENKQIDESLFTDGLHPNKKGYQILAENLESVISGL